MNVKSNHDSVLHVGRYMLRPGSTINVPDWGVVKESEMAKSLLAAKMIEEIGEVETTEPKAKKDK